MDDELLNKLADQVMELNGALKDGVIRVRTGIDNHTDVLAKISQQFDRLNDNLERLAAK